MLVNNHSTVCAPQSRGWDTGCLACMLSVVVHPAYCILSGRFVPSLKTAGHFSVLCLALFIVLTGKYLITLMLMLLYIYCSHGPSVFCCWSALDCVKCGLWDTSSQKTLYSLLTYKKCGRNDTCFYFHTVCAGSLQFYWYSLGPKIYWYW